MTKKSTGGVRNDGPTHLHFTRDAYLYFIIFCLVKIFYHEIFFWLISVMKVQKLLEILQFRS